jgi:hypothetical protein
MTRAGRCDMSGSMGARASVVWQVLSRVHIESVVASPYGAVPGVFSFIALQAAPLPLVVVSAVEARLDLDQEIPCLTAEVYNRDKWVHPYDAVGPDFSPLVNLRDVSSGSAQGRIWDEARHLRLYMRRDIGHPIGARPESRGMPTAVELVGRDGRWVLWVASSDYSLGVECVTDPGRRASVVADLRRADVRGALAHATFFED